MKNAGWNENDVTNLGLYLYVCKKRSFIFLYIDRYRPIFVTLTFHPNNFSSKLEKIYTVWKIN